MAGDWIKFEVTTPDKPEVVRMAATLGIDQDAVVGKLLRLWSWADQNSVDGNGVTVTSAFLDRLTFCSGFANAMRAVGWLLGDDGNVSLPNFERHNGKTAKERAVSNRRVAKHRSGNGDGNGSVTADVTVAPLQKPLPEKRREEKKEQDQRLSSSAKQTTAALPGIEPPAPVDIAVAKAERIRQIATEAVAAFNSLLTAPRGVLPSVRQRVGSDVRIKQVRRCVKIAREICGELYGATTITPEFWKSYFSQCSQDDFLSGRRAGGKGHENWVSNFEYLTREEVMLKVFDKAASEAVA